MRKADLQERLKRERERSRRLEEENQRLRREKERLEERIEQLRRELFRQAAPFRRPERLKTAPEKRKKPGRKAGHPGARRPVPERVDERVEAPLEGCPRCGGPLRDLGRRVQWVEEIPETRPKVFEVVTWRGRCPECGPVESLHPLQTSRAVGAAGTMIGPKALARAAQLNKEHGLSMRKTCQVMRDLHGLRLTPGGLSQALDRAARRLRPALEGLKRDLRRSPAVYADETSWWVGGPGWWLHVLADPRTILYRVQDHRSSKAVRGVLGEDFAGCLVTDCLATYNTLPYRQHKCHAHHLKAISQALEKCGDGQRGYLNEWKLLFRSVSAVHSQAAEQGGALLEQLRPRFQAWSLRLLDEPPAHAPALAVHGRLDKQRPHLLTCLDDLAVEPTNNRAERAIRPAVIARKISCGNKTLQGKRTWEVLASLAATYRQRGLDFVDSALPFLILQPP